MNPGLFRRFLTVILLISSFSISLYSQQAGSWTLNNIQHKIKDPLLVKSHFKFQVNIWMNIPGSDIST